METKFQTSFIPKKPLNQTGSDAPVKQQNTSILLLIGIFAFVISILAAGGSYGWQVYLSSQQSQYQQSLVSLENNFKIDQIILLKQTAAKIDLANQILSNHIALSQIFAAISQLTASNVRFTDLDVEAPMDKTKGMSITMNGYAPSYDALAFQSDELGHLEDLGLRDIVINPVISNPLQNQNSTISFQLSADVATTSMLYRNMFPGSATIPTTTKVTNL